MSIDVFISSTVCFNKRVFKLWLLGYSSEKTAQSEFNSEENESSEKLKYFVSEVNDNYRNFQLLLHFLKQPKYFETQSLFHISDSCKRFLVESYYEINGILILLFLLIFYYCSLLIFR
jgi:hypothetical protein